MVILIDADVLLQAERDLFDLESWLASRPLDEFKLAAITLAELGHGAESASGARLAMRQLFLQQIAVSFDIVPYSRQTALEHARLWAGLRSTGGMISSNDLILAATAIQSGSAVATFNKRRFALVKGLDLIEPA
jgi:predicted nucleic acid-binding protein